LSCKNRQHPIEDLDIAINRLLATASYILLGILIASAGGWSVLALTARAQAADAAADFSRRIREATLTAANNTPGLQQIAGDR
jgi:hypothetical protein